MHVYWRLGHTKGNCGLNEQSPRCKNCGLAHAEEFRCSTKCVNCNGSDHEADSNRCPAFLEAKEILKIVAMENIHTQDYLLTCYAAPGRSFPQIQFLSSRQLRQIAHPLVLAIPRQSTNSSWLSWRPWKPKWRLFKKALSPSVKTLSHLSKQTSPP